MLMCATQHTAVLKYKVRDIFLRNSIQAIDGGCNRWTRRLIECTRWISGILGISKCGCDLIITIAQDCFIGLYVLLDGSLLTGFMSLVFSRRLLIVRLEDDVRIS